DQQLGLRHLPPVPKATDVAAEFLEQRALVALLRRESFEDVEDRDDGDLLERRRDSLRHST
ncbi:MAG: hypothetical protein ACREQ9_00015, partial [Candidatus Binatia bacterium]